MSKLDEDAEMLAIPVKRNTPITVTRAFLPPREEYQFWLDKAWESRILSNNGPIHKELEDALKSRFDVAHMRLMANGTLALQLAIRALKLTGRVITTPYSYVATTSSILWEGCEPVFVDIKPETFCIDPDKIEEAITSDTTAILATHVYGIPCDVEAIGIIAKKHGLKVIYDAAHAFDVMYKGRSILHWGDASILSFHATKLFHTVEGGAVVMHDAERDHDLRLLRSFGHIGDEHFTLGINAKMSEVHAAMGMAVLPHIGQNKDRRRSLIDLYDKELDGLVERPVLPESTVYNWSYYPILLKDGVERASVMQTLAAHDILTRRYFYPSLNQLPYVRPAIMKVSDDAAERVLCLPLYEDLNAEEVLHICQLLRRSLR